jgi:hypothetical protein
VIVILLCCSLAVVASVLIVPAVATLQGLLGSIVS